MSGKIKDVIVVALVRVRYMHKSSHVSAALLEHLDSRFGIHEPKGDFYFEVRRLY